MHIQEDGPQWQEAREPRAPSTFTTANEQAWKALGDIWNLGGGEIAPSLQVFRRPGSVGESLPEV